MKNYYYKIVFQLQNLKNKPTNLSFYTFYRMLSFFVFILFSVQVNSQQNNNFILDNSAPYLINTTSVGRTFTGGDTIFVASSRTKAIKFQQLEGISGAPIVIININGQVKIKDSQAWGGITFENCRNIKISGTGHPNFKYGFELGGYDSGLAFSEFSSDCEAENIKIAHEGFFGIFVKKDFGGNPPIPYPVFKNLIIHDCFIENVSEGIYVGETKSPGMEFKHVRIYNNIIRNTKRESIQIANAVEDIEIYNNTMINAGLNNINYQTNNLQIGDNSVVNAYNNIIMQAPSFGIIALGKGNSNFNNNYISNSQGMFIDNRNFTDTIAPIIVSTNYFSNINGGQIIRNMNELNQININNNIYDTNIPFYCNNSGNSTNFNVSNNSFSSIHQINFKDPLHNDYSLSDDTPEEFKGLGATSGPEFFDIVPVSQQIIIDSSMVSDQVVGGSVVSPLYLFDEQQTDIKANQHPVSNSWKPFWYWKQQTAPYHVVIDLGEEYHITEIALHDMHNTYEFTVEFGSENNWSELFVDPCSNFKTWNKHIINVDTRYLRLSMNQNVFAAVNEIMIFGYLNTVPKKAYKQEAPINYLVKEKNSMFPSASNNHFQQNSTSGNFGQYLVDVFDIFGKKVLSIVSEINIHKPLEIFKKTKFNYLKNGVYIVRYKNETDGSSKTIKFYKN